jgi:hypothetical protein
MTCTTDPYCLAMKLVEDDGRNFNEPIWIETRYRYPLRLDLLQHRVGAWRSMLGRILNRRGVVCWKIKRDISSPSFLTATSTRLNLTPSTLPLGMTLHNLARPRWHERVAIRPHGRTYRTGELPITPLSLWGVGARMLD